MATPSQPSPAFDIATVGQDVTFSPAMSHKHRAMNPFHEYPPPNTRLKAQFRRPIAPSHFDNDCFVGPCVASLPAGAFSNASLDLLAQHTTAILSPAAFLGHVAPIPPKPASTIRLDMTLTSGVRTVTSTYSKLHKWQQLLENVATNNLCQPACYNAD